MYPFARFPFARFLEDIVQVELPMVRIHTCEFTHTNSYVIDQSYDFVLTTWYSSYLSYPLRFLAYLLNLYVDTWSCLHACPLLAYYDESYFAQHCTYVCFPLWKYNIGSIFKTTYWLMCCDFGGKMSSPKI